MKIQAGKQEVEIELNKMNTDQRLTYWDATQKKYLPVTHSCLPTSHFLIGIIGRCGSGKSTTLVSWLTSSNKNSRVYRSAFDNIHFICNKTSLSSFADSPFGEIPDEQIHAEFNAETLAKVWEIVVDNKENDLDTLLVIDDQVSRTRNFEAQFNNIALVHRHYRCSIIWCLQDLRMANPILRNNMSGILLFRNENKIREKLIHEEYLSFLTQKEFAKFSKYVWRNHGDTLYIDTKAHPMKLYRNYKLLNITGYESELPAEEADHED